MAGGSGGGGKPLQETPTWAVAVVCAVFVIVSVFIEHGIHLLGKWFRKRQKKALIEALEKIKAELMLLGFISLLLTVATGIISKICIPPRYGSSMLPCRVSGDKENTKGKGGDEDGKGGDDYDHNRRKLLWLFAEDMVQRRALAVGSGRGDYCSRRGKIPLISQSGLHQLHMFIFVLAVFHILYSAITMALAQAKMKQWKSWEAETSSLEYQYTNDPARFRLAHQTSFVRRHSGFSYIPGMRWIVAFFRQFFGSVTKVDYLTLRHGFVNAHLSPDNKFDFHKYIKRSMQDDFKVVVGISFPLWVFAILFLLTNVYTWHTFTWISFTPLIILLLVGTKLELIIMEMAQQIEERSTVVKGAPLVEPDNKYFWFNRPDWVLFLIHFTLFQNAFQMAYFLWTWYEFGLMSCFHENRKIILARVFLGVVLQILCSYITFPLYALVTQMGSQMKKAIFNEQMAKAIMNWHRAAKEKSRLKKLSGSGPGGSTPGSMSPTPSHGWSPVHLLCKHHSCDLESATTSTISYPSPSNTDLSEFDRSIHVSPDQPENIKPEYHDADFTFDRP
ncbi:MLO protein homolog 1-like [Punica granatum]|uniref:MLO-like protein n=2 Tax=Punica granatum TaxID=22663 RepID=A0A218X7E9_PUNGR|nr:MLO protein homolog 1-like [Punica granatum]OWM81165.1 hypothetical protein CDL15_Pgr007196 [Punica granatum]PKI71705.1 hypothetical protein CRG98_007927 [Punica granatum]